MNDIVTHILQDKELLNQYTTDLTKRQTTEPSILNDNIKATTYLFSDDIMNQNLSVETIVATANLLNSSNMVIEQVALIS